MEPGKLRSSARGRGAGASRVMRKGSRRKHGDLSDPPELEDVGWESPSVHPPDITDSKITLKLEPSTSQRPTRASSSKPFWENLPRTVFPCSQPVVAQRILNNNTYETEDLNLLIDELRQRRLDAKERALTLETALRKLCKEKGLTLEREPFYLGVQKWLHEPFPPEESKDALKDDVKKLDNDSDDSDVPLSRVVDGDDEERKKKKLKKTPATNKKKKKAEESDDEDQEEQKVDPPKDANKPLRAQQFWAEVDQFFEYPDEESVKLLQTTSWSDDEASKIAPCGRSKQSEEEDVIEIGGDDEDPKKGILGGTGPTPKVKKKKLTLKKLCLARSDPKIKKSILETDRVLRGESELLTSTLSQRTLSAVVDVPYATPKSHVQSCLPEPPSDGSPNSPKRSLTKKPNSTMEERLVMELRYLGVIPDDFEEGDDLTREDDEICIELRALQQSLKETTAQNNRIKAETFEACA